MTLLEVLRRYWPYILLASIMCVIWAFPITGALHDRDKRLETIEKIRKAYADEISFNATITFTDRYGEALQYLDTSNIYWYVDASELTQRFGVPCAYARIVIPRSELDLNMVYSIRLLTVSH